MGKNYEVLVVEDDLSIRQTLAFVLEDCGFCVKTAANGLEALTYLRSHHAPLVVLLDLMMPEMDGWEFLAIRNEDPALLKIPTVVMSASVLGKQTVMGMPVLKKPFETGTLIETLNAYI